MPMIWHGNPYLLSVIWFTLQVAAVATASATRDRVADRRSRSASAGSAGRRLLHMLANASLGLPPVLVGADPVPAVRAAGAARLAAADCDAAGGVHRPDDPRAALHRGAHRRRDPGAARKACWRRRGCSARAGCSWHAGAARGEDRGDRGDHRGARDRRCPRSGRSSIVGGNIYGYDQTLASAALFEVDAAHYADAVAIAIVLIVLILILMCGLGLLQQQGGGIRMRFRSAT